VHGLDVRKPLVVLISQKKLRVATLQHGLPFDNFKPRLKSGIFKFIFWPNRWFFEGIKTTSTTPMTPHSSPISFCIFNLISLVWFLAISLFRSVKHKKKKNLNLQTVK
jgi:hypothetical protein